MNKILLICSHLESDSDNFLNNLDSGAKFQRLNANYNNLDSLFLKKLNFEYNKRPLVYFDQILYNHEFSCKELFNYIDFVYIIGNPKKTLTNLVYKNIYDQKTACSYYCLRLRRIYEMIKKSKNYLVFFDEDLKNPEIYKQVHKMFNLHDKLKLKFNSQTKQKVRMDKEVLDEAEEFYEKYRYKIKNLLNTYY